MSVNKPMNTLAYLCLIFIWSTTPLAVKISAVELSFAGGIFWRILISAVLALLILKARGEALFPNPRAWKIYVLSALGIAPTFLLVYWASRFIPSGMISVIFSTGPFLIGILSYYWLGTNVFTKARLIGLSLSMLGIIIIFFDQLLLAGKDSAIGIMVMLVSVVLFAFSSTSLQRMGSTLSTLQMTTGGLCFSVPPLFLAWLLFDGQAPLPISFEGGLAILYLSIAGSLVGFFLYYFLLHRLSAYVVSTVGMASPVFALAIGQFFAGESLGLSLIIGAGMVLLGLALYHSPKEPLKSTLRCYCHVKNKLKMLIYDR